MNRKAIALLLCLLAASKTSLQAQAIDRNSFSKTDSLAIAAGPMLNLRLQTIVDSVTAPCKDELCQLRSIYRWVTKYISLDEAAARRPDKHNNASWVVLRDRKANSIGYAALFQEMCALAHIKCAVVSGHAKAFPSSIGAPEDGDGLHDWNTVMLKDQTYLIDVIWSAGQVEEGFKNFDPGQFDDGWFMTNRRLFALSHFPEDKKAQEDMRPVTKQWFRQAPVIRGGAEVYEVYPFSTTKGKITARLGSCLRLQFFAQKPELIGGVFFGSDQSAADQEAEAYLRGNRLFVDIPLETAGKQELWIKINDHLAYGFSVEVRKPG